MKSIARGCLVVIAAATLLSACARTVRYQDAPAQVVEQPGAFGPVQQGTIDGVDYVMATMVRTYPQDGKLGVCLLVRLVAGADVSQTIREVLSNPATTLTLKADAGASPLVMSPRFATVLYLKKGVGKDFNSSVVHLMQKDKPEGRCVVTDQPWQEIFATGKPSAKLKLMLRDTRQRVQSVVGAEAGAKQ